MPVDSLRQGAISHVRQLSLVPVELIRFSGVNQIQLVGDLQLWTNNETADGIAVPGKREIWVTLTAFSGNSGILLHEIGHHIAYEHCGGQGHKRDSEMAAANSPSFWYGTEEAALGAEVAEPHGTRNTAEDSATVMEDLLAGLNYDSLNPPSKAMADKYALWLARLTERVPGFDSYVRSISAGKASNVPGSVGVTD